MTDDSGSNLIKLDPDLYGQTADVRRSKSRIRRPGSQASYILLCSGLLWRISKAWQNEESYPPGQRRQQSMDMLMGMYLKSLKSI